MNGRILKVAFGVLAAVVAIGSCAAVRADGAAGAKSAGPLGSFWAIPKEDGKLTLVIAGQADPVTITVSDTSIFGGICQDCSLYMEFKPTESTKKCNVCGCGATNAACILGKPLKEGTWQAMLKGLPTGVALRPVYNDADKPESGLKKLTVDFKSVLLQVSGLDGQTPDQLLVITKPLGATQAELVDGGKRLSIHLKSDWSAVKESTLEKALAKLNAKVVTSDQPKPAQ